MGIPNQILIRSPNWIGDQILAYPFFHYLRGAYPQARIGVACLPWVQSVQFQNLVDEIFVLPAPQTHSPWDRWKAIEMGAQMIRKKGPWDLGICLPNSFSSAWLLYRASIQQRRGYVTDGRGILLTEKIPWEEREIHHRADAYVRLLPESIQPRLQMTEFWGIASTKDLDEDIPGVLSSFDVEKAWPGAKPFKPPQEPYWVLAPGATAESRRWSVEQFSALARAIVQETGWKGIIVGGSAEKSLAKMLTEDSSLQLSDWTEKGSVSSYWRVFRGAKFSVCNDSGLAHVASLCGSFVQVIWGAGRPQRTQPIGPGKVQVLFNPVNCWPCEKNTCLQPSQGRLECLKGIHADAVWKEIKIGIRYT